MTLTMTLTLTLTLIQGKCRDQYISSLEEGVASQGQQRVPTR